MSFNIPKNINIQSYPMPRLSLRCVIKNPFIKKPLGNNWIIAHCGKRVILSFTIFLNTFLCDYFSRFTTHMYDVDREGKEDTKG